MKKLITTTLTAATLMFTMANADANATKADSSKLVKAEDNKTLAPVYDLFESMQNKQRYDKTLQAMFKAQEARLPASLTGDKEKLEKYRKIVTDFSQKYVGWDKIREDMAKIYSKYYTEDDIKELKKFYATPVGQKVLDTQPKLSIEVMKTTQAKMMPHMGELTKQIRELMTPKKAEEAKK